MADGCRGGCCLAQRVAVSAGRIRNAIVLWTSLAWMRDRRWILARSGGLMARTPLMRALQRLAWEHRAASQLGIEVERLREREDRPGVPRREFLKRAGAVGAAAAEAGPVALEIGRAHV